MTWILIILTLLLIIVAILLFTPVRLVVDTPTGHAGFRWGGMVSGRVQLIESGTDVQIHVRVFWWERDWSMIKLIASPSATSKVEQVNEETAPDKKEKKHKSGLTLRRRVQVAKALIRSMRVRKFRLNIDTGDNATNGILYPIGVALQRFGCNCSINFNGKNEMVLDVSNRPANLIKVWLMSRK